MSQEILFPPAGPAFLRLLGDRSRLGALADPDGSAQLTGRCGDSVAVDLRIRDGRIAEVKVRIRGCAYTLACANAVGELVQGRDLDSALDISPQDVAALLGGLPQDHGHCAELAVNSLAEAILDHYQRQKTKSA